MAVEYSPFDLALCDPRNMFMELRVGGEQAKPLGNFVGELGRSKVLFQYPPKIESDDREAKWDEKEMRGDEPMALFKTSSARKITMKWSYVIDDPSSNDTSPSAFGGAAGGAKVPIWNIPTIKEQIRRLRGYFNLVKAAPREAPLVIRLKLWGIGGPTPTTGRLVSVNVKYS
jgi:hypothetical protein